MFLFTINLVLSILLLFRCIAAYNSSRRGTNVVTRFVRDTMSYGAYKRVIAISVLLTVVFTLISFLTKSYIAGLPSLAVAILCVVLQSKSNNSEQRKVDARKVTKATGKAAAKVATTAGPAIATAVIPTPATAAVVGKAAQKIGSGVDKALDDMDPNVVAQARYIGINVENKTKEELYANIVSLAPPALLAEAPKGISQTELADYILRRMVRK